MSTVFLSYDVPARRAVAVKILADHLAAQQEFVNRFYREARMSRLLSHPNLVHGYAYGFDKDAGHHYLILEHVDGPKALTLLDRHAKISKRRVELSFRGKGGKRLAVSIDDPKLAKIVKRCRDIPGQRLFQYSDARGRYRSVSSTDVNRYLRDTMGMPFTAKEFRAWAGSVEACVELARADSHQETGVRCTRKSAREGGVQQESAHRYQRARRLAGIHATARRGLTSLGRTDV